jgi:hypothetical protein
MTTFSSATEALALLLHGDKKRHVHFRIVDSALSTGNQRRFGSTEYLYCEKHCAWHEQKDEAYAPVGDWSKLLDYLQYVDVYTKPIIEQGISEKSNADAVKNESAAEPEHKQNEVASRKDPPLQQCCDDGHGIAIAVGSGCGPAATPEQR